MWRWCLKTECPHTRWLGLTLTLTLTLILTTAILSADEARSRERGLSPTAAGALYVPSEVVVDPWLVPLAYARHAHENGATIRRGTEVSLTLTLTNPNPNPDPNDGSKYWTPLPAGARKCNP